MKAMVRMFLLIIGITLLANAYPTTIFADSLSWVVVAENFYPSNSSSGANSYLTRINLSGSNYSVLVVAHASEKNVLKNEESTSDNTFKIDLQLTGTSGATGSFYVHSDLIWGWNIESAGGKASAEQNFDLTINGVEQYKVPEYAFSIGAPNINKGSDEKKICSPIVQLIVGNHLVLEGRVKAHAHGEIFAVSDVSSEARNYIDIYSVPEPNTLMLLVLGCLGLLAHCYRHRQSI